MPHYAFNFAEDVRAYSTTFCVEAASMEEARQLARQYDQDECVPTEVDWDSVSERELNMQGQCDPDEHENITGRVRALVPEPTVSERIHARPPVEVVRGIAALALAEKEIENGG